MEGKKILKQLKPYEQGMQIEEVKEKYNLNKIVKLASNENPFGFSEKAEAYLRNSTHDLSIYPDGYAAELRAELAKKLSVAEDEIVFSAGLDELIQIISRCYLEPGKNAVMADFTFPQYKHQALIEGAEAREIPLAADGSHDLDAMLNAVDAHTAVVWICSPNNPTGRIITREALLTFLEQCPKHVLVVLDEAYYEFVSPEQDIHAIDLLGNYQNLLVMRTFSKAYGLAALRIGYGITSLETARKLNIARGPFNTSSIAQRAARVSLDDAVFIQKVHKENRRIRESFEQFLDTEMAWPYFASETNFVLVETPIDDMDIFQQLLERGFIVRPGAKLGRLGVIRITIGEEAAMEALKEALREIKQNVSQVN